MENSLLSSAGTSICREDLHSCLNLLLGPRNLPPPFLLLEARIWVFPTALSSAVPLLILTALSVVGLSFSVWPVSASCRLKPCSFSFCVFRLRIVPIFASPVSSGISGISVLVLEILLLSPILLSLLLGDSFLSSLVDEVAIA